MCFPLAGYSLCVACAYYIWRLLILTVFSHHIHFSNVLLPHQTCRPSMLRSFHSISFAVASLASSVVMASPAPLVPTPKHKIYLVPESTSSMPMH